MSLRVGEFWRGGGRSLGSRLLDHSVSAWNSQKGGFLGNLPSKREAQKKLVMTPMEVKRKRTLKVCWLMKFLKGVSPPVLL